MNDPELEDILNRAIKNILPNVMTVLWSEIKQYFGHYLEDVSMLSIFIVFYYVKLRKV